MGFPLEKSISSGEGEGEGEGEAGEEHLDAIVAVFSFLEHGRKNMIFVRHGGILPLDESLARTNVSSAFRQHFVHK